MRFVTSLDGSDQCQDGSAVVTSDDDTVVRTSELSKHRHIPAGERQALIVRRNQEFEERCGTRRSRIANGNLVVDEEDETGTQLADEAAVVAEGNTVVFFDYTVQTETITDLL